jgi:hypothetical protein
VGVLGTPRDATRLSLASVPVADPPPAPSTPPPPG